MGGCRDREINLIRETSRILDRGLRTQGPALQPEPPNGTHCHKAFETWRADEKRLPQTANLQNRTLCPGGDRRDKNSPPSQGSSFPSSHSRSTATPFA